MPYKFSLSFASVFLLLCGQMAFAQSPDPASQTEEGQFGFRAVAELGFLGVMGHKVQFGQNTTYFDYRRTGGQDVLFPVSRLSLELDLGPRNTLIFLYQPLQLETQVVLRDDIQVDDLLFSGRNQP